MKLRKLIAVLAAILMVVSMIPLSVFAEMGGDFPWTDTSEKMLIEEILERDGLIDGVWFPWMDGGRCGHNLTGNDLYAKYYNAPKDSSKFVDWNAVELDRLGADKIYRQIYNLKAMGYNMMAYAGSIYAEGVVFDDNGDVIGIKEEYLTNARRLLDMCREIGMPVMWNVYFHSSTTATYYGIDGWKVICQMLGNPDVADNYAEEFVRPLCKMLAEYPDVVALVSIADEPENEINDDGIGNHFGNDRAMYGVNQDDMVYFMQQINKVVREELPGVARTVASNNGNKTIYRDFDLDLAGHNQYTDGDSFVSVESLITDADPILTEYNIGGYNFFDDTDYATKLITFREWMMNNGYKGGFQWCWLPDGAENYDQPGSAYYLLRDGKDDTSFRKTVTLLKQYMDEYRAAYRGATLVLDAPTLYANAGDGKVLFIPSKRATTITIQRSDDGGNTWKTVLNNATQSNYVDEYLIGSYTDSTAPATGYCYRIIATDANGNSVTSQPNNVAGADAAYKQTYTAPTYQLGEYYRLPTVTEAGAKLTSFTVEKNRPATQSYNLITNGGFESADGQWNTSDFLQYASVVEDATTPDGDKSLYFDTSANGTPGWYTFTVSGLKQNTEYTFSSWLKGAYLSDDNKGFGSIGVVDPDTGNFMVYWEFYRGLQRASQDTQQLYPPAWDDEWHLRSVSFNSGAHTTVTIALYGYASQMWVDGLALFESINGKKYENGESSKAITDTDYNPDSDAVNAVTDPQVNDADYWSAGAGYKQGFMSLTGGKLTYLDSPDPKGVRYTKWIDVKPGTDYYYSFTVNVTSAGNGRVAILDNSKLLPNEVVTASFSSVGQKTYTGRISTGKYDQLGLCVVDLGGIATIDNICLYEGDKSVEIPTEPSFDGYIINGDFEVGSSNNWENLWNNSVVEIVEGRNSLFAVKGIAGNEYAQIRQKIAVEKDTDYVIELWSKNASNAVLLVKDSNDANLKQVSMPYGSSWSKTTLEFNSGDNEFIYLGLMGNVAGATYNVDDVKMRKKYAESNDGFIVNGDFEVGTTSGWENLWGSNTVTIVNGHNSSYGMKVNANQYTVVRETVSVKANTDYVIEAWVKDCYNACLLVKDHADSINIVNSSLPSGSAWQKVKAEFNSGNNTTIYVGFMGSTSGATYTVDDVTMYEKTDTADEGLINGGFEYGEDGWAFGSGYHAIVSDAHSGNYALQLQNPNQWGEAAVQTFAVKPYTTYTITWWYKAESGTGVFNLIAMHGGGNMDVLSGRNFMNSYNGAWKQETYRVNTGDSSTMMLKFTTEALEPGTILIDDIEVTEMVCDHDYDISGYINPTCISDGEYVYTCDLCHHSYTEIIPATGVHDYDSTVTKEPTCASTGVLTYTCRYCGYSCNETIPATGNHTYDHACDAYCNVCNAYRYVSHSYSGVCDAYCNICGYTRTVYYSHTYDNDCDPYCNVCQSYRSVTHTYDGRCDADCNICGYTRYVYYSHTYDNDCDAYCNVCWSYRTVAGHKSAVPCQDSYCFYCYTFMSASADHAYDNVCVSTTCNNCGEIRDTVPGHTIEGNPAPCLSGYCTTCEYYIESDIPHTVLYPCSEECSECGDWVEPSASHTLTGNSCIGMQCSVCVMKYDGIGHDYEEACSVNCTRCGYVRNGNNIVVNGDFEDGEHSWAYNSGSHAIVSDSHSGNGALQLTNPGVWAEGAIQTVPVQPYTWYTISWWCKAEVNTKLFNLYTMNADGYANLISEGQSWMNNHDGTWKPYTIHVYTAEANAVILKWSTEASKDGAILIDDIVMHEEIGEHNYNRGVVTYPDCVNGGYTTYTCYTCGHIYTDDYTEAIGHDFVGEQTKAPTCTEAGEITYICYDCGDRYTEEINAYGHTAGAEADCENAQICVVCGAELQAALGHDYNSVVTAPDCENGGYTTYTCSVCGDSYVADNTEAIGHDYVGEQTKAPTCAAVGVMTYTCSACGDSYTEEIAVVDEHTYDHEFDAECNVCGAIREVDCSIAYLGASVSENVRGLAMLFQADVEGIAVKSGTVLEADFTNATYNGYQLLGLGAIVTNGIETITIKGHFLYDMADDYTRFAFRLVNIPADKLDVAITMTPYYAIEIDGVETIICGKPQTKTYNEANS